MKWVQDDLIEDGALAIQEDITPKDSSCTVLSTWGRCQRPWGYEVRVDLVGNVTGHIYNEVLTFQSEPDVGTLNVAVDGLRTRVRLI